MTAKEMDFIADCLKNEDLLIKQSAQLVGVSQQAQVRQLFSQLTQRYQQHHQHLMSVLQQHQSIAPSQLQ